MSSEPTTKKPGLGGTLDALMGIPGVLAGMVATDDGLPLAARLCGRGGVRRFPGSRGCHR